MNIDLLRKKVESFKIGVVEDNGDYFKLTTLIKYQSLNALIFVIFYQEEDKVFMTDDYFLFENWVGDDEVKNLNPIKLIEKFATKYNVEFFDKLELEIDSGMDLLKQIQDFIKVEIYADKVFAETENK